MHFFNGILLRQSISNMGEELVVIAL